MRRKRILENFGKKCRIDSPAPTRDLCLPTTIPLKICSAKFRKCCLFQVVNNHSSCRISLKSWDKPYGEQCKKQLDHADLFCMPTCKAEHRRDAAGKCKLLVPMPYKPTSYSRPLHILSHLFRLRLKLPMISSATLESASPLLLMRTTSRLTAIF